MVTLQSIFKTISERLTTAATVKTIYGDPIVAEGKTIIPVAKVRFGFGAGFGESDFGESGESDHPVAGKGGGGGGGVEVRPIGFIEITPGETRFVPIGEGPKMARLAFIGLVVGIFLLRRRHRKKQEVDSDPASIAGLLE